MNGKPGSRERTLFRLLALAVLCFSLAPSVRAQPPDDDPAPYLYYYSDVLNGIVIERADGSDSRIIGQGLFNRYGSGGMGWSPDGRWFTSHGVILDAAANLPLEITGRIHRLNMFDWSPDGHYLFASGDIDACDARDGRDECDTETFWIIDLNADDILASTTILPARVPRYSRPEWSLDEEQVVFYDDLLLGMNERFPVRITLRFDGTVLQEPITSAEANRVFTDMVYSDSRGDLDSPSGHYTGAWPTQTLLDIETGRTISLLGNSEATDPRPIYARWHPSENWVILGYNGCVTDCSAPDETTVMSLDGRVTRELASCGFGASCVGWLPDTVDLGTLPPGQPDSLTAAPLTIEFLDFMPGIEQPHVRTCNEQGEIIQDASTDEILFLFPHSSPCTFIAPTRPIDKYFPFAFNPAHTLYATRSSQMTGLFDVSTGQLVGLIGVYPTDLAFNEDGSVLEVRSYQALTTWDVQEAISRYADK
jgi:hypothetical protein